MCWVLGRNPVWIQYRSCVGNKSRARRYRRMTLYLRFAIRRDTRLPIRFPFRPSPCPCLVRYQPRTLRLPVPTTTVWPPPVTRERVVVVDSLGWSSNRRLQKCPLDGYSRKIQKPAPRSVDRWIRISYDSVCDRDRSTCCGLWEGGDHVAFIIRPWPWNSCGVGGLSVTEHNK